MQFSSLPSVDVFRILIYDGFFFKVQVTAGYALLQHFPFGLFQRFSVLCHNHEPVDYEHWHNGFYMKFDDVLIQSKVECVDKCETLKVAGRAPNDQLDNLWRTLLILLEVHCRTICCGRTSQILSEPV